MPESRRSSSGSSRHRKKRSRWSDASSSKTDDQASAELEKTIAARSLAIKKQIEEAQRRALAARFPAPLILDEQGRQVDAQGNVVVTKIEDLATIQANRAQLHAPPPPPPLSQKPAESEQPEEHPEIWHDPRVKSDRFSRQQRSFNFVKPGVHIRKAQNLRLRQMREDLRTYKPIKQGSKLADALDNAVVGNANMVAIGSRIKETTFIEPHVPDVEWWDAPFCGDSYSNIDLSRLNSLVQHPVPLKVRSEPPPPPLQQMMLTEKEKKKIRRMRQLEKQREQQDMIRLGLIPPPQPRITLKNMMRVMPNEAIEDPTAVEAKARAEMEKRQIAHQLHNESRRLTPQQHAEKKRRKLEEDTSREVIVALFRIDRMDNGQIRFKVSVSADEHKLSGCMILLQDCNVVIVEGGPRGIRKYTKLMLNRIQWSQDNIYEEADEDLDPEDRVVKFQNKCSFVWTGSVQKRGFSGFRMHQCSHEEQARKLLSDKNLGHYWDMCRNFEPDNGVVIV